MSTQKSGISIIDPTEFRPPLEFRENGLVVTSFGGIVVAMGFAAVGGEFVVEVNDKEVLRRQVQQGKFEVRRCDFIDDETWAVGSELLVKLKIVEGGAETATTLYRFTRNYTREYEAYRQRDALRQRQRELLETRRGPNELVQTLARIAERSVGTKSYPGKTSAARSLADLAREFAGIQRFGEISDAQVLATFLEEDAVGLASTLPNDYWFATCLRAAVKGDIFQKISKAALEAAISEVAIPIKANIAQVGGNSTEVISALKAIEGVVLIADGQLVDNPVFAD